jgi:hypothetical protein
LGISEYSDNILSGLERSEYDVVLERLADEADEATSSSKFGSGAARFFPLESRTGSLMVKAVVGGGSVVRWALRKTNGTVSISRRRGEQLHIKNR